VPRYLRDPTFSRFETIPECDRQTDRHTTMAYTALSIASRSKNENNNIKSLSRTVLQLFLVNPGVFMFE